MVFCTEAQNCLVLWVCHSVAVQTCQITDVLIFSFYNHAMKRKHMYMVKQCLRLYRNYLDKFRDFICILWTPPAII